MLDLNLDIANVYASSRDETPMGSNHIWKAVNVEEVVVVEETSRAHMEDSGTSNSSIIINNSSEEAMAAQGDENSSNDRQNSNHSELRFDVFGKNTVGDGRNGLRTQELFPERGESVELNLAPSLDVKRANLWLGLSPGVEEVDIDETEMRIFRQKHQQQQQVKKRRGPRSRSSQYRGVTFYRRTGRWESHIWDCGKQVYLGGFDTAHAAARAYDRAAIRFRGVDADINFNLGDYDDDMKQMRSLSKEEFVQILRRQSTGFARGTSKFRAPPIQKSSGWDERIRSFMGKDSYENPIMDSPQFQRDSIMGSRILDSMHNLDLSLGISTPSSNPGRNPQVHGGGRERPIEAVNPSTTTSSVQTFHGLPLPRQSTTTWPAISGLVSTCQARSSQTGKAELGTWQWQAIGNHSDSSISTFPVAASSGFSSRATTSSSSSDAHFNRFYSASSSSAAPAGDSFYHYSYRT